MMLVLLYFRLAALENLQRGGRQVDPAAQVLGVIMKKPCILLGILLILAVAGAQADTAWEVDAEIVNEHVTGSMTGKSYTFDIDAILLQNAPATLQRITLKKMDLSENKVIEAVTNAFQMPIEQASAFIEMTDQGFYGSDDKPFPIMLHGGFVRKPKVSEQQLDEILSARLESCKRFLDELSISYEAVPFTACYVDITKNDNGWSMLIGLNEAKSSNGPLYVEVVLMLSTEGMPIAPRVDYMRFGGKMRQQPSDKTKFLNLYAGFLFDEKGRLRYMDVALPQGQPKKEISGQLLPWEKALEIFLEEYTAIPLIQDVLTHVRYCITDIRLVWAVDGDNDAVPAWYIGMSGYDSDLTASGQVYDRRAMYALVYAVE